MDWSAEGKHNGVFSKRDTQWIPSYKGHTMTPFVEGFEGTHNGIFCRRGTQRNESSVEGFAMKPNAKLHKRKTIQY